MNRREFLVSATTASAAVATASTVTPALSSTVERLPWCGPISRNQVGVFAPDPGYVGDGEYILDDGRFVRLWHGRGSLHMNEMREGAPGYLDHYVPADRADMDRRIRGRLIYMMRADGGRWR